MLITNATGKKIRLSVYKDISEDEGYEAFAYIIAHGCSLNIPETESYCISIDEKK